jgi:two-component system sporulation sensor kinase A
MYFAKLIVSLFSNFFLTFESQTFEVLSYKHALSTPLTILMASLDEIEHAQHADKATFNRYKVATLSINQLITQFNQHTAYSAVCNVLVILKQIKALLETKKHKIKILFDSESEFIVSWSNETRLKEAFVCLIKNALESSDSESVVYLYLSANDNYISLIIKDYGEGMEFWKQTLSGIPLVSFKKFGNGIGLPFAKRVITNELRGYVTIASRLGYGSSVECLIPKHQSACTQIRA